MKHPLISIAVAILLMAIGMPVLAQNGSNNTSTSDKEETKSDRNNNISEITSEKQTSEADDSTAPPVRTQQTLTTTTTVSSSSPSNQRNETTDNSKTDGTGTNRMPMGSFEALSKNLSFEVELRSEGLWVNDLDMKPLDNVNYYAKELTDDQSFWAYAFLKASITYQIMDDLMFATSISTSGLYGHDRLGNYAGPNLNIDKLYLDASFSLGGLALNTRLGRQFFSIGGTPKLHNHIQNMDPTDYYAFNFEYNNDYLFSDTLDALVLKVEPVEGMWNVSLLIDLFASRSPLDVTPRRYIDIVRFLKDDGNEVVGYDGDTQTFRFGFLAELDFNMMMLRPFAFFTRFGASDDGGADIAGGYDGNVADHDFAMMGGIRATVDLNKISSALNGTLWADAAASYHVDRRSIVFEGVPDVQGLGVAFSAGAELEIAFLRVMIDGFYASGGTYDNAGTQMNHGFISFKGSHVGGIIMNSSYGIHPAAYTDHGGIADWPSDLNRKTGSFFAHAGLTLQPAVGLTLAVDGWMVYDTNSTAVDFTSVVNPSKPIATQQRFGRLLGYEINLIAQYQLKGPWEIFGIYGLMIPGSYYSIQDVDNISHGVVIPSYTPGSRGYPMALMVGSRLKF